MWDNQEVIELLESILTQLGAIEARQDQIIQLLQDRLPDPQIVEVCIIVMAVFTVLNFFVKKRYQT